jgi:hypothetical protein
MRLLKLDISKDMLMDMAAQTDYIQLMDAIGYLSTWNMDYPVVDIFADGDTDLVAIYCDEYGKRQYVIGAVWHDDHFGYHS